MSLYLQRVKRPPPRVSLSVPGSGGGSSRFQQQQGAGGGGGGIESPEFTSPFGSPRDEDGPLSAKGRFLELKRLMQDDLDSNFK